MSEENITPNDPNTTGNPPWNADPNAPSPNDPQWGGQAGVSGGVDQTTGTPTPPYEGRGYQGTRDPQPGGPGGDANLGQTAGASNPSAGSGGSGSGYGGPVSPGEEADMPTTDPGHAGNASWTGQGQGSQNQDQDRWAGQSQGDHDAVNSGQPDTGYVNRNDGDELDDVAGASQSSFPASDPPSFNPGRP